MNRFLLITTALIIFSATILWALRLSRQPSAFPGKAESADRIAALLHVMTTPESQIAGQPVIFPPGAGAVVGHSFFPLSSGHALNDCAACHANGVYQGTDPTCMACHASDDAHEGAHGSDCATCHTAANWHEAVFDHSLIGDRDCAACHTPPPDHFAGACSSCHFDTSNFQSAIFNHSLIGNQDCATCHTPPLNHFAGACSSCHFDTSNFQSAIFNHSLIGNQDCAACHTPPLNHYQGTCRNCHTDTTNFGSATFDHSFPLDHGGAHGQCTACHTSNDDGRYTCVTCHNGADFEEEHQDEGIVELRDCLACHPDGREADD